jgi:hypothetical protein
MAECRPLAHHQRQIRLTDLALSAASGRRAELDLIPPSLDPEKDIRSVDGLRAVGRVWPLGELVEQVSHVAAQVAPLVATIPKVGNRYEAVEPVSHRSPD